MLDVEAETLPGIVLGHRHIQANAIGAAGPRQFVLRTGVIQVRLSA
jgi:hypothetical protein